MRTLRDRGGEAMAHGRWHLMDEAEREGWRVYFDDWRATVAPSLGILIADASMGPEAMRDAMTEDDRTPWPHCTDHYREYWSGLFDRFAEFAASLGIRIEDAEGPHGPAVSPPAMTSEEWRKRKP